MTTQRVQRFDVPSHRTDDKDRGAALDAAAEVLGADFYTSGKSTRDIRLEVLARLEPMAHFDGKPDDYIHAAFDAAVNDRTRRADRASLAHAHRVCFDAQSSMPEDAIDAAQKRADAKARATYQAGPPAGAAVSPRYRRDEAHVFDGVEVDGHGSAIEKAQARADAAAKAAYEAGPPRHSSTRVRD